MQALKFKFGFVGKFHNGRSSVGIVSAKLGIKLLSQPAYFYSQFGTHNAYTAAAIMEFACKTEFEFQYLYGIGKPLYEQIVDKDKFNRACRIYAPVGTHKDLLGYLVRRLLENGANSSFVNKLADDKTPIEKIVIDPVARIAALEKKPQ